MEQAYVTVSELCKLPMEIMYKIWGMGNVNDLIPDLHNGNWLQSKLRT